jgi:hypothetical protein
LPVGRAALPARRLENHVASSIATPPQARTSSATLILLAVALAAWATACGSSGAHPGGTPSPDARRGTMADSAPPINAVNPLGSFFENRVALGLADSQVVKLEAVDKEFVLAARPLRRRLDSLRSIAQDWPGYRSGATPVDTSRLPPPARDSVRQLRDAVAGASADLHVLARHARSQALDLLTIEQLERVARMSGPLANADYRTGGRRSGGSYNQGGPTAVVVRPGAPVSSGVRDPLRGITLTDSQRTAIDSIRAAFHAQARDLGDPSPATAAPLRDLIRRQYDAIRAVLTPEQRAIFDRNRNPVGGGAGPARADSARVDSARADSARSRPHTDSTHTDSTHTDSTPTGQAPR